MNCAGIRGHLIHRVERARINTLRRAHSEREMVEPKTFCLLMALLYGGFGLTMFNPLVNWFYGPDSIIAYFTVSSEMQTFFERATGLLFITLTSGPFVFGVPFEAACKQYLVFNLLSLILFAQAAISLEDAGPGPNAILPFNMWWPQVAMGVSMLALNVHTVMGLPKGEPSDYTMF